MLKHVLVALALPKYIHFSMRYMSTCLARCNDCVALFICYMLESGSTMRIRSALLVRASYY